MKTNKERVSTEIARQRLGLKNRKTVQRMVNDGRLKGTKIGGNIQVYVDSIDQLINAGMVDQFQE